MTSPDAALGSHAGRARGIGAGLFCGVLYALVGLWVMAALTSYPSHPDGWRGFDFYYRARFADIIEGKAYKPYVYRALVPQIARRAARVASPRLRARVDRFKRDLPAGLRYLWFAPKGYDLEFLIVFSLGWLCLGALPWILRALMAEFYRTSATVEALAPAVGVAGVPCFIFRCNYLYDPPTLFFSALGLLLIVRRSHFAFYVIFALACLNKESALLLAPIFVLRHWNREDVDRKYLWRHLAAQALIWLTIKALLSWRYHQNPGGVVEWHLLDSNLNLGRDPASLPALLVAIIIATLVRIGWHDKPRFLRAGMALTLWPLVVLMLFVGCLNELRDYYEAFPLLFLLAVPTVPRILRIPCGVAPRWAASEPAR